MCVVWYNRIDFTTSNKPKRVSVRSFVLLYCYRCGCNTSKNAERRSEISKIVLKNNGWAFFVTDNNVQNVKYVHIDLLPKPQHRHNMNICIEPTQFYVEYKLHI